MGNKLDTWHKSYGHPNQLKINWKIAAENVIACLVTMQSCLSQGVSFCFKYDARYAVWLSKKAGLTPSIKFI